MFDNVYVKMMPDKMERERNHVIDRFIFQCKRKIGVLHILTMYVICIIELCNNKEL